MNMCIYKAFHTWTPYNHSIFTLTSTQLLGAVSYFSVDIPSQTALVCRLDNLFLEEATHVLGLGMASFPLPAAWLYIGLHSPFVV
jgi:hypothetical protein